VVLYNNAVAGGSAEFATVGSGKGRQSEIAICERGGGRSDAYDEAVPCW